MYTELFERVHLGYYHFQTNAHLKEELTWAIDNRLLVNVFTKIIPVYELKNKII